MGLNPSDYNRVYANNGVNYGKEASHHWPKAWLSFSPAFECDKTVKKTKNLSTIFIVDMW
jgi:hypothetical protein